MAVNGRLIWTETPPQQSGLHKLHQSQLIRSLLVPGHSRMGVRVVSLELQEATSRLRRGAGAFPLTPAVGMSRSSLRCLMRSKSMPANLASTTTGSVHASPSSTTPPQSPKRPSRAKALSTAKGRFRGSELLLVRLLHSVCLWSCQQLTEPRLCPAGLQLLQLLLQLHSK